MENILACPEQSANAYPHLLSPSFDLRRENLAGRAHLTHEVTCLLNLVDLVPLFAPLLAQHVIEPLVNVTGLPSKSRAAVNFRDPKG